MGYDSVSGSPSVCQEQKAEAAMGTESTKTGQLKMIKKKGAWSDDSPIA